MSKSIAAERTVGANGGIVVRIFATIDNGLSLRYSRKSHCSEQSKFEDAFHIGVCGLIYSTKGKNQEFSQMSSVFTSCKIVDYVALFSMKCPYNHRQIYSKDGKITSIEELFCIFSAIF